MASGASAVEIIETDVAIIGAGAAGLSAAIAIAEIQCIDRRGDSGTGKSHRADRGNERSPHKSSKHGIICFRILLQSRELFYAGQAPFCGRACKPA